MLLAEGPEGAERWENVRELVASAADWSEVVGDEDDEPSHAARALPRRGGTARPANDKLAGSRGRRHADDPAHRQGARVAGRGADRARGRALPAARAPRSSPAGSRRSAGSATSGSPARADKLYLTWARDAPAAAASSALASRRGSSTPLPPEMLDEQRSPLVMLVGRRAAA